MLLSVLVSTVSQFGVSESPKNIRKSKINRKKDLTGDSICGRLTMLGFRKG